MEYGSISQHLFPFHHSALQRIERRILAVVNHTGIAHSYSFLEIISSETFTATHNMRNIQTVLSEMHQRRLTHLTVWHTGYILYIIA